MRVVGLLVGAVLASPNLTPVGPLSQKLAASYSDLDKVQDSILAAQKVEDAEIDKLPKSPNDPWDAAPSSLLEKGASPNLTPVGPISQKLAASYSDLDKVQDSILAAQKVEDAEIDKLPKSPNDPWDAAPSSLLEKGDDLTDGMETKGTINFGELDALQSKFASLHSKMGGELSQLKTEEVKDEAFATKEEDAASVADATLSKDSKPSSLLETEQHRHTLKDTVLKLEKIANLLEPMKRSLIHEVKQPVSKHERVEAEVALRHLFAIDALSAKSVKLMDELKLAAKSHKHQAVVESIHRLKAGFRAISIEVKRHLHALQTVNVQDASSRAHNLVQKLHAVLRPLQEKLHAELKDHSPLGQAKIKTDRHNLNLLGNVVLEAEKTITLATEAHASAHNPAERSAAAKKLHSSMDSIERSLVHHLKALRERRTMAPGSLVEASPVATVAIDSNGGFGDVGYGKIEDNLKGLQQTINGQVNTLKSQVAQESSQQVQQLDNMLDSNPQNIGASTVSQDALSFGMDKSNLRID